MFWQNNERVNDHTDHRDSLRTHRGNRRPAQAQFRQTPIAENQQVVGESVKKHRNDRDPKHHLGLFQSSQIALEHHRNQKRKHTKTCDTQITLGIRRNTRVLPQQQQHSFGPDHQWHHRDRKSDRQPQPHARGTANADLVFLSGKSSHHRHHCKCKPCPKQEQRKEIARRQCDRSQCINPVPPQHDGIGDPNRKLRQMPPDKRKTKGRDSARMGWICHKL